LDLRKFNLKKINFVLIKNLKTNFLTIKSILSILKVSRGTMNKSLQETLANAEKCYKLSHFDEAAKFFVSAFDFEEANKAALLSNLSVVSYAKKDFELAARYAQKSLILEPDFAQAHFNLANAHVALKNFEESLTHYEKAVSIDDNFFDAHYNMGNLLSELGRYETALESYKNAIKYDPANPKAYINMAIACAKLNRNDQAFKLYAKALELDSSSEYLWLNIALLLQSNKEYEKAKLCLKNALDINPDFTEAKWSLALLQLALKEFDNGWRLYEERFSRNLRERLDLPFFRKPKASSPCKTKTIFVASEQGFGDSIMFCRFLPMLAERYKKVLYQPPKELARIMKYSKAISDNIVLVDAAIEEDFDEFTSICSLPFLLGIDSDDVPLKSKYLTSTKSEKFNFISGDKNLKIGIVWQGSIHIERLDKKRSISLNELEPLFYIPNTSFYALQKGYGVEQVSEYGFDDKITILSHDFEDFADTAEAIEKLDIIITVDTSVAHLSAALGKPTWILIDTCNCFRWGVVGENSYWYDSVRLFRQETRGEWGQAIALLVEELN
jgi:tetratricopeptide (TPR) repeat protein